MMRTMLGRSAAKATIGNHRKPISSLRTLWFPAQLLDEVRIHRLHVAVGETDDVPVAQGKGILGIARPIPAEVAFENQHCLGRRLEIACFHATELFVEGIRAAFGKGIHWG